MALALSLNAAVLAVVLPWLRREWRACGAVWRAALVAGLAARLLVGWLHSVHLTYDAAYYDGLGQLLNEQLWTDPAGFLESLTGDVVRFGGQKIAYYGLSNTLFMGKVVCMLDLFSMGVTWLNGLYLSVWSFVGCWHLARALARALPATPPGAGLVALVLWPSVAYLAVGVSKEAVLLGSGTWLAALVVVRCYGPLATRRGWRAAAWWAGVAGLAVLHVKMRYFFALPLLGALLAVALVQALRRQGWARARWAQVLVLGAVLGAGTWLAPQVSVVFHLNKFTSQMLAIYAHDLELSVGQPHFEYPNLRPTAESLLAHTPQAVANTFTRPWLGESSERHYVAAGLENVVLLALGALALAALVRGRGGRLPFALAVVLLGYCLLLAALIGLSTPNLGTLIRYRSTMLPFWVLLLLQNDYAAAALRRLGLGAPAGPAPAQSPGPVA
ncbi:MAG: hypothetical protein ACRYFR_12955 [Janthinobacterium lividum]